jgi:hypothetical protein
MSDDADRSQERMEHEDNIRRLYSKRPSLEALPTGSCLNCGEDLHEIGQRWCDADCREDWSVRQQK